MIEFFKRLFRSGPAAPPQPDAAAPPPPGEGAIHELPVPGSQVVTAPLKPLKISVGGGAPLRMAHAQSVGVVRDHNEDVLLTITTTFEGDERIPTFGLYIVADGMGGHNMGERASAVAARSVAHEVVRRVYVSMLGLDEADSRPPLQDILQEALTEANRAVVRSVGEGGTTLTVALALNDQVVIGHVGDSRAYFIAQNTVEQLTRDHSLVRRLQELGQLSPAEAAVHPQRNVLYRAVGQGDGLEVDVHSHRLSPGMKILLCSDGLWGLVSDAQIAEIVNNSSTLQAACDRLVEAANEAGGPDNITAVLVEYVP